jgi:hypothetical protein
VLAVESERIALEEDVAVLSLDLELVVRTLFDPGNENFPDAAAEELSHDVHAAIPVVEIPDHADALRVRRPDAETDAGRALDRAKMRAELAVNIPVVALGVKMHVGLAEHAAERIRVALLPFVARVILQPEQIRKLRCTLG